MRVVIVAKTRMKGSLCVGGLALESHRSLRLHRPGAWNQPEGTEYEIGQVWDMTVQPLRDTRPPHTEDVIVTARHLEAQIFDLRPLILHLIRPWTGGLGRTFDGCPDFTVDGIPFITARAIPQMSTGFWVLDKPLQRFEQDNKVRYAYSGRNRQCSFRYVGLTEPPDVLQAGTLARLSLARWLVVSTGMEERCYLQLSGWFSA